MIGYCIDCVYWGSYEGEDRDEHADWECCIRHAPSPIIIKELGSDGQYSPVWPCTHEDDCCGEFEKVEE